MSGKHLMFNRKCPLCALRSLWNIMQHQSLWALCRHAAMQRLPWFDLKN